MISQDEIDGWNSRSGIHLGHGTYIGPAYSTLSVVNDEEVENSVLLKGKTAIACSTEDPTKVLLQFDDRTLREAYGWHEFPAKDFMFDLDLDE